MMTPVPLPDRAVSFLLSVARFNILASQSLICVHMHLGGVDYLGSEIMYYGPR